MEQTSYENKLTILSDLWITYRHEDEFTDFIEYNDVGLPLAFMVDCGIATTSDRGKSLINETFDLLLAGLGIEDTGFETLEDLLGA